MISPTESTRLSRPDREDESDEPYGSHRAKRHRRGHRACYRRARVLLVVLFVAFNATNGAAFLVIPERIRYNLWALLIVGFIWSSFLFAAIALRQKWARYVMVGLQLLVAFIGVLNVPELFEAGINLKYPAIRWVAVALVALYAIIGWILIASHDLKRLTSRAYE